MIHVDDAAWLLVEKDPTLKPWTGEIRMHMDRYNARRWQLCGAGSLSDFANGHRYFGFHRTERGWVFREWLPGADAAWLTGDFNGWDRWSCPLNPVGNGVWELVLEGWDALRHGQFVKLLVGRQGSAFERIPAYIRRCVMDMRTETLCGQIWLPEESFPWTDADWYGKRRPAAPMIYEAHIGMAQEHGGIGSYREFADQTLPWIQYGGYNTVQLMAIQEHPYYASFGYQVSNFFAPSHRYGTPEDLKYLIDQAHARGIAVLLDLVHSHACPNEGEGLNGQDGTDAQYFLPGDRGWHPAWKTRVFDYGRPEVLHFLLSNLKYWQEEFHFDGFRFDGVTSMLYENHGYCSFTRYEDYFSMNTNVDGRVYLMLANELIHGVNANAMTVAEDVSGFPGLCLPLEYGGVGFDYRLAMGMPDVWIRLVKDQRQEDWDMYALWGGLTGGRPGEKSIGYCESHDQSLVGDQALMFRLAGAEMYSAMRKDAQSLPMDRAMDMHKLIRFLTCSLAGDGYLNFIGNEFGHPEWVDFPREGNNWSTAYARRQWSLVRDGDMKYDWLAAFDRAMTYFINTRNIHCSGPAACLWIDNERKLILFARGGVLFAFNLHPTRSQEGVFLDTRLTGPGGYRAALSTDHWPWGGQDRIGMDQIYRSADTPFGTGIQIYLPCRSGVALERVEA
ncbi:MAG: alpha amylase C-terminal domain-containing protein [Oscillospiraceae bacterium]|nr:alpha amylase C-terminal domain-containing protein [Oscillospiraceae bacterium]